MKRCCIFFLFLGLFLVPEVKAVGNYDGYLVKYKTGKIEKAERKPISIMSEGGESDIEFIQPNYIYDVYEINEGDRYWYLKNSGQIFQEKNGVGLRGEVGVDLGKYEADELTKNDNKHEVIVAVVDMGVDYTDPIFNGKLWDGSNCKDWQGNNLSGCVHGYDFVDNDKEPLPSAGSVTSDHGTHVAGIINSIVGSNVKIMILKVGKDGKMSVENISKAIQFAKINGAKILNASFGTSKDVNGLYPVISDDFLTYNAVESFGGLFVNAAGNESTNIDTGKIGGMPFPASLKKGMGSKGPLSNIMVVSASNYYDDIGYFSNFGKNTVDVAAPGMAIYGVGNSGQRLIYQGTSMAAPMVSGVAAYLLGLKSAMSTSDLIALISGSGVKADGTKNMVASGRRLNLDTAVRKMKNMDWDRTNTGSEEIKRLTEGKVEGGVYGEINSKFLPEFLYFYVSDLSNSLQLLRCGEIGCGDKNEKVEIAKGDIRPVAFTLTDDDRPVILSGGTFSLLRICDDKNCTSSKDIGSGNYGIGGTIGAGVKVDSQGRIVWAFYSADKKWVVLNRCVDAVCSSYQSLNLSSGIVSQDAEAVLDLEIDKNDKIYLSYNQQGFSKSLWMCDGALENSCQSIGHQNQSIYGFGNVLAIDENNNVYWAYPVSGGIQLNRCIGGICEKINSKIAVSVGSGSLFIDRLKMEMNVSGVPMMVIGDDGDKYGVKIIKCKSEDCSQSETKNLDDQYGVGESPIIKSMMGGAGGVAYMDILSGDVKYHIFLNYLPVMCSDSYSGKDRGDYNCDNSITGGDYIIWRREFLDGKIGKRFESDGNGDGRSSITDYSLWREMYLK